MSATEQIAAAREMVDTWTLDHLRPHEYAAMCVVAALADTAEAQAQEIARLRDALKDIEKADFTACPFDSPDCQVKPDEPCPVCGDQNTWDQISQCKSMGASAAARAALGETP